MDGDNMGYVPNLPSYDPHLDYATSTSDYWQQSFAQQHDPQPTHSAPFFENQQDVYLTGSEHKTTSMFSFTGAHTQTYRPFPASTMQSYETSDNSAQKSHIDLAESPRQPPSKRQRISQVNYDTRVTGATIHESDRASLCGTESECCSSCSGGIPCDEPDCSPCDEVNCVGAAVEVCSVASCSKPACRDECLSTAFQAQSSLGNVVEPSEDIMANLEPAPWSAQAQQSIGKFRTPTSKVDPAIVQSSPATTPSMAHHSETPGSPYPALPTPQNNMFDQQASYSSPAMGELSGTGAMFQDSSEQWNDNSFGATPEVLPCGWEGCNFVCMSHEEWVSHFHSAHIDTQMQFGCPVPADNCPPTLDANPFDHLQTVHGYEFDFSSGTFSCPATTCPADQTYGSPRMFHDHLDHYHATPVQGSLQCRLQTCGTVFNDPNQFFLHMTDHLQGSVSKNEEIDLLAPSTSATAAGPEPVNKLEHSDLANLPHVCMWKSKNGDHCNYEGTSAADLQDHVKDQHLSSLGKSTGYICQWEGCRRDSSLGDKSGFSQRGKLERHMATHTGFKCSVCPTCGQFFSAPQALRQHILLHTGEKPWKCKHCDKRFPQQSACTIHERTHTNEKPLECNICGKKFSESSNLAKHRKIHGEKGLHACPIPGCGKSFHRLDQLKRHAMTHDKPPKDVSKKRAPRKQKWNVTIADELEGNGKKGLGEDRVNSEKS
ncbi:zinc-finger protein [Cadophora gregata]|uniref:zinc-finger protein n=1 Tax=Cadophora gregata TaxID=51156 RepID=UPI0026DCDE5E|nr:zinc-finger protein [Cadophora gregata]KAK0104535.1 zinc-finger protein [Cadophora gregata]